jgi:23S rRNA (uracil-5-)-methyltransferase RumA
MQTPPSAQTIQAGDRIVVTVKKIGINGEGIGYFRRKAVFIDGALPGEVVKAEVTQVASNLLYATLLEREKTSPQRLVPPCPAFRAGCGGCQLQHLHYEGQLRSKQALVQEAFVRYCGEPVPRVLEPIGMDDPWRYRNKAQFQLGYNERGEVIAGLYSSRSRRLLALDDCPIQPDAVNSALRTLVMLIRRLQIPVFREKTKRGVLRSLVIRVGADGLLQVTLVSAQREVPQLASLLTELVRMQPNVASVAVNVNDRSGPLVFGAETFTVYGEETMRMELDAMSFNVSPRAFFQLNDEQTVKLYNEVKKAAALSGRERVVDAYCGTGTIGLWLAEQALEVRGIETIAEAVDDARANALLNQITNASFYVGRAETLLPEWVRAGITVDVIIVDPPRTGCDVQLLHALAEARPRKIVYVSCNPATLAKDCHMLRAAGFQMEYVQPIDMFPQTAHVECVMLMTRV